jgi:GT2 family glycosyltransferase
MLTENCIEDSVKAIEEQGVDFIHGKSYTVSSTGEILSTYIPPEAITYADLLQNNYIHGGTLMFRKRVFDKLGGYKENLHHSEEYEFNLRAMQAGFKLGYCDKILYFYRRHEEQKSFKYGVDLNNMGREVAKQHKKEFEV